MNYSPMHRGKSPNESRAQTTVVMLPSDANPKGNVFGGVLLKHVDLIAGLVAKRHAGHGNVVTASIDKTSFLKPIFIGNALILSARINYVKRSSMEVEINIEAEDLDDEQNYIQVLPLLQWLLLINMGRLRPCHHSSWIAMMTKDASKKEKIE